MSKIDKMLKDWVTNNFISDDQAKQISQYENSKPGSSWVLYGFLALGAVIIGIGVISIIAANWDDIPDWLRLVADFTLLISLSSATYFAWDKKKEILFEVLLILMMILCLASIGLISQIYHTGGEFYHALLLWSFMTVGLAMVSKKYFAPMLWATGFLAALTWNILELPALEYIFRKQITPIFMAIPLISALFAVLCRRIGGECGQTRAFRIWTVLGGMGALFSTEMNTLHKTLMDVSYIAYIPAYVLGALVGLGIWYHCEYKKGQKLLLLTSLSLYMVPFHFPMFIISSQIIYAIFTIAILAAMAIFLASLKHRRLFQVFLNIIGLRFLILYFQAFGGLATTGLGLIFSGLLIVLAVMAWHKYKKNMTSWAEGFVK